MKTLERLVEFADSGRGAFVIITLALIGAAVVAALTGCGGQPGPQPPPPAHSVTVGWDRDPDVNPLAGGFFNVYRGRSCPPSTKVGSTPALQFTDMTITPGSWCMGFTPEQGGVEGKMSNTAMVTIQ